MASNAVQIALLEFQIRALQKNLEEMDFYSSQGEELRLVWCADLGEITVGSVVGIIEIGSEIYGGINIRPAQTDGAAYDADRDGINKHNALIKNPIARFYAMAIGPAKEKWYPRFRYGELSDLDGDTASVNLRPYASAMASKTDLNIKDNLYSVPIEYPPCNGGAFSNGDIVVVSFTDNDWNQPKVIGFKDNPKTCGQVVLVRIQDRAFLWQVGSNDYLLEIGDYDADIFPLLLAEYNIADPNPNYTGDLATGSILKNNPLYDDFEETVYSVENSSGIGIIYWDLQFTGGHTKYPNSPSGESYFKSAPEYTSNGYVDTGLPLGLYGIDDFTAFSSGQITDVFYPVPLGEIGIPPDPSPFEWHVDYIVDSTLPPAKHSEQTGIWPYTWIHEGAYRFPYEVGGLNGSTLAVELPGAVFTSETMVQVYFYQAFTTELDVYGGTPIIIREDGVKAACNGEILDPLLQPRNTEFETACQLLWNQFIATLPGDGTITFVDYPDSPYYKKPYIAVEIWEKTT